MNNTLLQPAAFLALLYGGILAGFCYDVCRLLRRILKSRLADAFLDGVFLLCATALAAASLLFATGGELRLYLAAAYFLGFFAEQWSVGHLFFRLFHSILAA